MNYRFWLGFRYVRNVRKGRFAGFIAAISGLGIALGVASLIVVLSVMDGFQHEIRTKILDASAHIQVSRKNLDPIEDWEELTEEIKKIEPTIQNVSPFSNLKGLVVAQGRAKGIAVRGILPEKESGYKVKDLSKICFESLKAGSFNAVVGMGVGVGDKFRLMTSEMTVTPAGAIPRSKTLNTACYLNFGMKDFSSSLILMHIDDVAKIKGIEKGSVEGLKLMVEDPMKAGETAKRLRQGLSDFYDVTDWSEANAQLFNAMNTEKTMMFMVLSLVILIAAFNLISGLVMTVKDKKVDIAVLRTMGATKTDIGVIFLTQGILIGLTGTLAGVCLGSLLSLNMDTIVPFIEHVRGAKSLPIQEIYGIDGFPSDLSFIDIITVSMISLLLTIISVAYPAYDATSIHPAEALRYE